MDPLAEKYYPISTYAYVANNPIRFIDPDGRVIVDANDKAITYSPQQGWSSNATYDVIRLGRAMMSTPTGREMFYRMLSSETRITMKINPGTEVLDDGRIMQGSAKVTKMSGDRSAILSAEIVVFEGGVQSRLDFLKKYKEKIDAGRMFMGFTERDLLFLSNMPITVDEIMATVAGHEAEHILNTNANINFEPDYDKREELANRVQDKMIRETPAHRLQYMPQRNTMSIINGWLRENPDIKFEIR